MIVSLYHPCSNPGVGISEGCFVFHFVSLTFGSCSSYLAYHVHKSGRKTSIIIFGEYLLMKAEFIIAACTVIENIAGVKWDGLAVVFKGFYKIV